jgi:sterol desaturase/sphingolipid hydroxylase (fatty acid hydroxylase superfamily)
LILYWIHRISHKIPKIKEFHFDHHRHILNHLKNGNKPTKWHWNNLFLYNDTLKSTIDLWLTEVIPTLVFSLLTGQWWIFIFYYLWAALLQEIVEHDPNFNFSVLTSGRWHITHHLYSNKNYSLFFPVWDLVFKTNQRLTH